MTTSGPINKLKAVNRMLRAAGENETSSLQNPPSQEIVDAEQTLDDCSEDVQSQGWWFNREFDLPLQPGVNGDIALPFGTSAIALSRDYYPIGGIGRSGTNFRPNTSLNINDCRPTLIPRDGKVFNQTDRTFEFLETIFVDATFILPFEDLPDIAARYIAAKAAVYYAEDQEAPVDVTQRLGRRMERLFKQFEHQNTRGLDLRMERNPTIAKHLQRYI